MKVIVKKMVLVFLSMLALSQVGMYGMESDADNVVRARRLAEADKEFAAKVLFRKPVLMMANLFNDFIKRLMSKISSFDLSHEKSIPLGIDFLNSGLIELLAKIEKIQGFKDTAEYETIKEKIKIRNPAKFVIPDITENCQALTKALETSIEFICLFLKIKKIAKETREWGCLFGRQKEKKEPEKKVLVQQLNSIIDTLNKICDYLSNGFVKNVYKFAADGAVRPALLVFFHVEMRDLFWPAFDYEIYKLGHVFTPEFVEKVTEEYYS